EAYKPFYEMTSELQGGGDAHDKMISDLYESIKSKGLMVERVDLDDMRRFEHDSGYRIGEIAYKLNYRAPGSRYRGEHVSEAENIDYYRCRVPRAFL
ncbi:hypothetical protein C9975_04580, partial [Thalassospira xiamenensis]